MPWNSNMQSRFDELRRAELNETLTADEQAELAALVDVLYEDEGRALTPAVAQMQAEQQLLQSQIEAGQGENAELARLLNQQQQLVATRQLASVSNDVSWNWRQNSLRFGN